MINNLPEPTPLSYREIATYLNTNKELRWTNQMEFLAASKTCGQIKVDSRQIKEGDVFLAIKGMTHDGNSYLKEALANGAGLIITDQIDLAYCAQQPTIAVKNSRRTWSLLCSLAYQHPEQHLDIIGITGTNGKTSTAWMINQLLTQSKQLSMLISSVGAYAGDQLIHQNPLTTPDPDLLYRFLAYAHRKKIKHVVMEVSSHAIALHKTDHLKFKTIIFTSFSQDHLDFHKSMAEYFATKWHFVVENCEHAETVILHRQVAELAATKGLSVPHPQLWVYDTSVLDHRLYQLSLQVSLLQAKNLCSRIALLKGSDRREGWVNFFGTHAVLNFAAALLTVEKLLKKNFTPDSWAKITSPPGRMQIVSESAPLVIVDYAHTPAALRVSLQALAFAEELWIVFGCGGNRDGEKRSEMGAVATQLANWVILTADNPRNEDPKAIIADILAGIKNPEKVIVQLDRFLAIEYAIMEAKSKRKGVVLVAGKGAESYQEVAGKYLPFDDRTVCQKIVNAGKKP